MNRLHSIIAALVVLPVLGLSLLPVHFHDSGHGPNSSRDCPVCLSLRSASHIDLPGEVRLSPPATFERRALVEHADSTVLLVVASFDPRAPPA